ncbi:UNVERIFIED_CONTAM: hypothetical protein PYX00_006274 [Menopon gallinae]|uniref:Ig-like domain-containing protein n=1 Tax=Menopon gallinae TaxID=328185 RepID=A0AAW2HUS4_9NEOP
MATFLIYVADSPSFAISREPGFGFPIREGIPVSLKCDVDSNPPSSPVWQKDDMSPPVAQSGDGFLNFSAIKREHSGWYKCTSHHLLGDFSSIGYFLNVRYDPVVEVTQDPGIETVPTGKQIEVALGGAVQLQCPEDTTGCWSRVGVGGRLEAVGPGPGLALEDILYQDAGEYRCVAGRRGSYDKWRSEVNVDVTVKGRPVVYPANTSITAYTGQQLDFSVEFCANPPSTKAFWITETQRLRPGQVTSEFIAHNITAGSSIHCQQAHLTLKRVQPAHEGEYIFLVRSPKGLAEGSVVVNVTRVSGYSSTAPRWLSLNILLLTLLTHCQT